MVQTEHKAEDKPPHIEHTSPIRSTTEKHSSVLSNRTLRDITHLLDPYKRNSSDSLITTLTHTIHCYDRAHKLLQSLDLDSQRITQSSQAIQSALESMTTLLTQLIFIKFYIQVIQISSIFHRTLWKTNILIFTTGKIFPTLI